jgi:anti-sigma regulatory factor (Ser/Thr protein kinase)
VVAEAAGRRTAEVVRGGFSATLGDDPAELEPVRRAVRALASSDGFADRAGDLALALDEVVANAQEHGRPPITVVVTCVEVLTVEVHDLGRGFDHPAVFQAHPPSADGCRGFGLWIARQLMDAVTIESGAAGTRVRLELCPRQAA